MISICSQLDGGHHHDHAERSTAIVLALTLVTMAAEIVAGWWTGSMALLADGWHMAMHAAAMGVALIAYRYARTHARSARYTFGAGKAADLGAFTNAVLLGMVAVLIAGESVERLVQPAAIDFDTALLVAVIGLGVNLLSAWLLRNTDHDHGCGHAHQDNNREAAFVHVLSDALTSGLAIVALLCGRQYGIVWLDPLMGLVGALVIVRWSLSLARRSSAVLLDAAPDPAVTNKLLAIVAEHGDEIHDLHIWPIAAGRYAAAISAAPTGEPVYRERILAMPEIVHLTVERRAAVEPAEPHTVHACGHHH